MALDDHLLLEGAAGAVVVEATAVASEFGAKFLAQEAVRSVPTHRPSPTGAHRPPPTGAHRPPPTAHRSPPIAHRGPQPTAHRPPPTAHRPPPHHPTTHPPTHQVRNFICAGSSLCGAEAAKFIPVVGNIISGSVTFVLVRWLGMHVVEDARRAAETINGILLNPLNPIQGEKEGEGLRQTRGQGQRQGQSDRKGGAGNQAHGHGRGVGWDTDTEDDGGATSPLKTTPRQLGWGIGG